jgi:hypothetical protein
MPSDGAFEWGLRRARGALVVAFVAGVGVRCGVAVTIRVQRVDGGGLAVWPGDRYMARAEAFRGRRPLPEKTGSDLAVATVVTALEEQLVSPEGITQWMASVGTINDAKIRLVPPELEGQLPLVEIVPASGAMAQMVQSALEAFWGEDLLLYQGENLAKWRSLR